MPIRSLIYTLINDIIGKSCICYIPLRFIRDEQLASHSHERDYCVGWWEWESQKSSFLIMRYRILDKELTAKHRVSIISARFPAPVEHTSRLEFQDGTCGIRGSENFRVMAAHGNGKGRE